MAGTARPPVVTYLGFVAWVVYAIISARGDWTVAACAGLLIMLAIVAAEHGRNSVRIIDCTSLGFFALALATLFTAGEQVFRHYQVVLAWGIFALVTWVTMVIGFPFTIQYTRERQPRESLAGPLFRRLNVRLTMLWAIIFTFDTGLAILTLGGSHSLILVVIIPGASMLFGYVFSIIYPARHGSQFRSRAA